MKLNSPFIISSRLLPALVVGGATIQLEYDGETRDGRTRYRWTIDLADGSEHTGRDLSSEVGGGSLQEGFESLLSFLAACGEGMAHARRRGNNEPWNDPDSNASLFPQAVAEFCDQYSDELGILAIELQENRDLIQEDNSIAA